jgi:hypothetical protein
MVNGFVGGVSCRLMPAQPDTDTNAGSIVAVGLIGSILLVVVVVALEALFGHAAEAEARRKVVAVGNEALRGYTAEQLQKLRGYRSDPATGAVAIPIERAMELVVQESAPGGP